MNIIVVTGASSGIGKAFAEILAKTPGLDEIWLIARRADRLKALADTLPVQSRVLTYDLTDPKCLDDYAALLKKENPAVLRLVNASGFGRFADGEDVPLSVSMEMIDLNIKALVALCELTIPYIPRGGGILNMGSRSAFQPLPFINLYAATKVFVLNYSRALNVELVPKGIRVMVVCPMWVQTEFFDHAVSEDKVVKKMNRLWTPEEVAEQAMKDFAKGKDTSILGAGVRFEVALTKLLPHKLIMNIWLKQQGLDQRIRPN